MDYIPVEAFDELWGKYNKRIYYYFRRQFDEDTAEDLCQQTFMNAWKYISVYGNNVRNNKSWLFTVARNVKNDHLRYVQLHQMNFNYENLYETDIPVENNMDESIDLFDSYSIHTNADQIGGCTLVDFDEENQKSIFLITVQHMDGTSIEGSVMTFNVSQFLTGKNEIQAELTQISLDAISEVTETQKEEGLDIRGGSYTDGYVPTGMAGEYLYEDDSKLFVPTPGVTVTNYGFVNDKLHIQVYYEDILQFDNHGYVYLSDADGNDVLPECSTAFWDEEKQGSYEEYIFDVNAEALENYKIYGHFFTCQNHVEGDWEVRFTIKNQ